jgi:NADH-quinone oxidoreductase subunit J
MTVEMVMYGLLGLIAVLAALGMLLSKNAVYSALFLVLNFFTVAVFYLLLSAPFLAMAQITVYAGAIMVLFLFVIMLLGAERLPGDEQPLAWQKPLAIVLALALAAESLWLFFADKVKAIGLPPADPGFGTPQAVGELLFNKYLLPFEVMSIILLVAMVGAIVLTRQQKGDAQ